MRKRTFARILDSLFWFILIIFPLLYALVASAQTGINTATLTAYLKDFLVLNPDSFVYSILEWFAANVPALGIDTTNVLWLCVAWMFTVELMHLVVDIILFIFKLAQRLLDKVGIKE